jgi:hypothetical protein
MSSAEVAQQYSMINVVTHAVVYEELPLGDSTGCRYALLGGNVLSTGVVVLTTCVYFALFW